VVNASWGLDAVNACDDTFKSDIEALRAAGIVVVIAAGNAGPSALTSISPANDVDGFSAGAVDDTNTIAYFSSRGPSACTGGTFPTTVAPGVNIKTSAISLGGIPQYTYVTGTSFSAPHVAGAAAILAGAFPTAAEADIEQALRSSAKDLGPVGPDDDYGYGLVDAYAAFTALAALSPPTRKPGP
jgi:bacillopeptidase F